MQNSSNGLDLSFFYAENGQTEPHREHGSPVTSEESDFHSVLPMHSADNLKNWNSSGSIGSEKSPNSRGKQEEISLSHFGEDLSYFGNNKSSNMFGVNLEQDNESVSTKPSHLNLYDSAIPLSHSGSSFHTGGYDDVFSMHLQRSSSDKPISHMTEGQRRTSPPMDLYPQNHIPNRTEYHDRVPQQQQLPLNQGRVPPQSGTDFDQQQLPLNQGRVPPQSGTDFDQLQGRGAQRQPSFQQSQHDQLFGEDFGAQQSSNYDQYMPAGRGAGPPQHQHFQAPQQQHMPMGGGGYPNSGRQQQQQRYPHHHHQQMGGPQSRFPGGRVGPNMHGGPGMNPGGGMGMGMGSFNGMMMGGGAGGGDMNGGTVYVVQHKNSHRHYMLHPQARPNISVGDFVIVDGDRGEDLGVVVDLLTMGAFIEMKFQMASQGGAPDEDQNTVGQILRVATLYERQQLPAKYHDEQTVVKYCSEIVASMYMIPMAILDAEFQFDRHKLTIFYDAGRARIDFRELVRDLYATYKTRIWMKQVDVDGTRPFFPKQSATMALATGVQFNTEKF